MARKKNAKDQPSAEDQALHERVYEMMELDRSKELKTARSVDAKPSEQTPIDIFKDLKSEPPVVEAEPAPESEAVPETEPEPEPVEVPIKPSPQPIDIEDAEIDKVVDEVLISEGDDLLAAEDIAAADRYRGRRD